MQLWELLFGVDLIVVSRRVLDDCLVWAWNGQDGKGGALAIQQSFIVSNSGVKFENCSASEGGSCGQ